MANKSGFLTLPGGYESAVTAAGTTTADAAALTGALNLITTVAAGAGVKLPNYKGPGAVYVCRNTDADSVVVYPPTGGSINAGAADAGFTLAQNKTAIFFSTGDGTFLAVLTA